LKHRKIFYGFLLVASFFVCGSAFARVGVIVDIPFPGYYYPYPYPYYPPVVVAPAQPPVYIEQQPAAPQPGSYWYHCNTPEGYYPYVKACPSGWQQVAPTPAPQQ
jgi:hypothetical protein